MVYDSQRGYTLLFGGQGPKYGFRGDTWTYQDGCWEHRRRSLWSGPSSRCGHAMAFDESTGETVLFGGVSARGSSLRDTWLWNGDRWREIRERGPQARRYAAFAFDPRVKGRVLHGGAADDQGRHSFGDTWLFRNHEWSRLSPEFNTDPRDDHGLAYHRTAQQLVLLEGLSGVGNLIGGSTTEWIPMMATPELPRLQCSPLAWDDQLGGLVMHGGETGQKGYQFDTTWVLRSVGE